MRDRRVSKRGRVVLGRPDSTATRAFVNGRRVRQGFDVDDSVWLVDELVCLGRVDDEATHAAALDLAMRGADVVVDLTDERESMFLDDVRRAGLVVWTPDENTPDEETAALLGAMAQGSSVAQAARLCNMSERSAHRRLAAARGTFDVATNTELVSAWMSSRSAAAFRG